MLFSEFSFGHFISTGNLKNIEVSLILFLIFFFKSEMFILFQHCSNRKGAETKHGPILLLSVVKTFLQSSAFSNSQWFCFHVNYLEPPQWQSGLF